MLLDVNSLLLIIVFAVTSHIVANAIYNVYFHPLRRFPGPTSHAISRLPFLYRGMRGTMVFNVLDLHEKYGDIVRIAPDHLAISHPDAWKELHGHKNGQAEMVKPEWFYNPLREPPHITTENGEGHRLLRRQLAHSFSEKGLRSYEPIIRKHTNRFVEKLRLTYENGRSLALSDWFHFVAFDSIGELAFGESFGCLENGSYGLWVGVIRNAAWLGRVLQTLYFVPIFQPVLSFLSREIRGSRSKRRELSRTKLVRRMALSQDRIDLISGLLKKQQELNLGFEKLTSNAEILIMAGSDTTSTLLCGVTFLLLQNPHTYRKLENEVHSSFATQKDITMRAVLGLPYMRACLDESLRMYPPAAGGLPRICPPGGQHILGEYVPEGMNMSIYHWATYRREKWFKDPHEFHPERFLGDPKYRDDRMDAFQPFHIGPRNCIGRNLAYAEMHMIMALLIFNFKMELSMESSDWMQQKVYLGWAKGPLMVYLIPREGST